MKKKILLFGNFGRQNWGDEAILKGILTILDKKIFEITVLSTDPEKTRKDFLVKSHLFPPAGFRSIFEINRWKTFNEIKKSDLIIFSGGLLQDREPGAVILWSWFVKICKFFNKKIIFAGNSIGPLENKISKKLAQKSLESAKFISVRDKESKKLAISLNIPNKKIFIATDFCFNLRAKRTKKKEGTLLAFRGDGKISVFRAKKLAKNFPSPIEIVAMDKIDKEFAENFGFPVFVPNSLSELRQKIANKKVVVGSRLHAGILALKEKTPFVLFSAADKISNFFDDRGLAKLVFSESRIFEKKIRDLLKDFQKNSKNWEKKFTEIITEEGKKRKNLLPSFLTNF